MLPVNNCWCSPTWRLTFSVNIFRIRSCRSMIWASHVACIRWYVTVIPRLIYNSIDVVIHTPYNWYLHFVYQFSATCSILLEGMLYECGSQNNSFSTKRRKHVAGPHFSPQSLLVILKKQYRNDINYNVCQESFFGRLSIVSHKSGKVFNTYVF